MRKLMKFIIIFNILICSFFLINIFGNLSNIYQTKDMYIYQIKALPGTPEEEIIEFLNNQDAQIAIKYYVNNKLYTYGNNEYYYNKGVDVPSKDEMYTNVTIDENTIGQSLEVDLKNEKVFFSLENLYDYQHQGVQTLFVKFTDYEEYKKFNENLEKYKYTVVRSEKYNLNSNTTFLIIEAIGFIFLMLIYTYMCNVMVIRESKELGIMLLNGYSIKQIIKGKIYEIKSTALFGIMLVITFFFLINIGYIFSIRNIQYLILLFMSVVLIVLMLLIIYIMVMRKKILKINVVDVLKNKKLNKSSLEANVINGISKIMIIILFIVVIGNVPLIYNNVKISKYWENAKNDIYTPTLAWAVEDERNMTLETREKKEMDTINYFTEQYNGWFAIETGGITDFNDNSYLKSLVITNENYLEKTEYYDSENISDEENYILYPSSVQDIGKLEDNLNAITDMLFDGEYTLKEYEEGTKFYTYNVLKANADAYYSNPILIVIGEGNVGINITTDYIYQHFYYEASDLENDGLREVKDYYETEDLLPYNKFDSKYMEYSLYTNIFNKTLYLITVIIIIFTIMYVISSYSLIKADIEYDIKEYAVKRMNGLKKKEVYKPIYLNFIKFNLAIYVIITVIALIFNVAFFVTVTYALIMLIDIWISGRIIKIIEKKAIIKSIKNGE